MKLKKLAIIISATALVVSLTACGENKNQNEENKGTSTPTTSSVAETESTTVSEPTSSVVESVESETAVTSEPETVSDVTTESEVLSDAATRTASEETATDTSTMYGLYEENGVVLNAVGVELIGTTPNLMLKFENISDKEEQFDFGKFEIQTADEHTFKIMDGMKTFKPNQPYSQHAVTFDDEGLLHIGDEVGIYYDGQLLATVVVEEF